jgi:hypothetical protein
MSAAIRWRKTAKDVLIGFVGWRLARVERTSYLNRSCALLSFTCECGGGVLRRRGVILTDRRGRVVAVPWS